MTETSTSPTEVVQAFLDAFVAMDLDTALTFIADDCEYTNIPMGTGRGRPHHRLARLLRPRHSRKDPRPRRRMTCFIP